MLKPELEQLIRQSLRALEAEEVESVDGVHRYRLMDGLKERLGREEILITFSARTAAQRSDVDLVSAGSYLYDLILRLVRERGRAAAGWLPVAPGLDPVAAILKVAPRLKGRTMKPVKRSRGVVYLFTFRFGFHFDTPHEKLYTVRVDHDGERVRHDVHPWRLVESATPDTTDATVAEPRVDPERAFRFAWEKVEEEVARLTSRYGQEAEAQLREEIQTVELYYRQLIEEEKRVREQKNTKRGREESEQKIELLKLEWDRRVAEEKKRLRPEVTVVLSCAAYLRTPLERWKCAPRSGTREALAEFWVDLHSGEAWPVRSGRRKPGALRPGRPADEAAATPGGAEAPLHAAEGEGFAAGFEAGRETAAASGTGAAALPRLRLVELDGAAAGEDAAPRAGGPSPSVTLGTVAGGLDGSADDALLLESLADPGPLPFDDSAAGAEAEWPPDEDEPEEEIATEDDAGEEEEEEEGMDPDDEDPFGADPPPTSPGRGGRNSD